MRILRTVVAIVVVFICFVFYWHIVRPYFNQVPAKLPEQVVKESDERCLRVAAWDDAYNEEELVFVVFAVLNLATELKKQPCDIYKEALTIRAPYQPLHPMLACCGRKIAVVEQWARLWNDTRSWQARAELTVEKVLKDRGPYLKEHPWLRCVTRYIRSHNQLAAHTDKVAMRSQMRFAHSSSEGAEFFCPK